MNLTLLSTVVAPSFTAGQLILTPIPLESLSTHLKRVTRNLCGHPVTDALLRIACPSLPPAEKAFWDGKGLALAVRPKGGVRGSLGTDVEVAFGQLEAVLVEWYPGDGV